MDEAIVTVYRRIASEHRCSAEGILEHPELRNRFLNETRKALGRDLPEPTLLHRLSYLRKKRRLPRRGELSAC